MMWLLALLMNIAMIYSQNTEDVQIAALTKEMNAFCSYGLQPSDDPCAMVPGFIQLHDNLHALKDPTLKTYWDRGWVRALSGNSSITEAEIILFANHHNDGACHVYIAEIINQLAQAGDTVLAEASESLKPVSADYRSKVFLRYIKPSLEILGWENMSAFTEHGEVWEARIKKNDQLRNLLRGYKTGSNKHKRKIIESLKQGIEICKKGSELKRMRDKKLIDTIEQIRSRPHIHRIFVLSGCTHFTQEVLSSLAKYKYIIVFPQLDSLKPENNHSKNEL